MTKKHFRALAERFNNIKPEQPAVLSMWQAMVYTTADVCQETNERFDRRKFIFACEKGLQAKSAS